MNPPKTHCIVERGQRALYDQPEDYDYTYRRRSVDRRFYVEMADRFGSPLVELGSGTGRISIPLAQAGHKVIAIEGHRAMHQAALDKATQLPVPMRRRLHHHCCDFRQLQLAQRFRLIIAPFNALMHLYSLEDIERCLRGVHEHLTARGRFVFDVLLPDVHALARNPARFYRHRRPVQLPSRGRRYHYAERFAYDPISQIQLITMHFDNPEDPADYRVIPLSQRQFFPSELEALLHCSGLEIEARFGDFAQGPLTATSESQIYVVKRRQAHAKG